MIILSVTLSGFRDWWLFSCSEVCVGIMRAFILNSNSLMLFGFLLRVVSTIVERTSGAFTQKQVFFDQVFLQGVVKHGN